MIDADSLVSILTYCIVKSEIKDITGHIKLIEEFTSVQVQNSRLGQALFTLKAVCENIQSGILIKRMSSLHKFMRSISNSREFKVGSPSALKKTLSKIENRDFKDNSENVSEDN